MKYKVGDRVRILNFQAGETGTVVPEDERPDLVVPQTGFIWVVKLDNGEYRNYRDQDIRKLTKLEQALK